MADSIPGILAIFNNAAPGRESDLDTWFQTEHLAERLAVPGFWLGRRYEAVSGNPRYFNYYVTRSVDVLTSAPYLARLEAPTPMTRIMMTEVFRDMIRTLCHRVHYAGTMRGGAAVILRFNNEVDVATITSAVDALLPDPVVTCGEVWMAVPRSFYPVNEEERLRGGDRRVEACVLIETLREVDAQRVAAGLSLEFPDAENGVYRRLCEIRSKDAPAWV